MMELSEMIERARQMRGRDRFGVVEDGDFEGFDQVSMEDMKVRAGEFEVHMIRFTPPSPREDRPMFVNFHGGGFIKGRYRRDDLFCCKLATILGCEVVDMDYSLTPENPFPYAVNEMYEAVKWLFGQAESWGVDRTRIVLGGQSSGGNLVCTTLLKNNGQDAIQPCAAVLCWTPLDLFTDPETKPRPERDMPADRAKLYNSFYCAPEDADNVLVSPIFADEAQLKTFPKTMFIIAGQDSLAAEDEMFAGKLIHAGVEVAARRFEDSMHGFMINRMDEWEEAFEYLLRYLREVFEK